jgi:hypothetical protein
VSVFDCDPFERWPFVLAGLLLLLVVLVSGCAGYDDHYCGEGRSLRHDASGGWRCEGFGAGFRWERVSPSRVPWWGG